jgi:F-type H+-transporting ATPase subunit b
MAGYIASFVAFLLIVYFAWRKIVPPVRKLMREQQETIRKQVEQAEVTSERLAAVEKRYRDALADARTEAAKIRDGARADAQRIVAEMRAHAEAEVERIRQRGEEDLVAQRQQVIRELRIRIGTLAVDLATELVTEHLSDQQRRSATVDRLLAELESMSATEQHPSGDGPSPAGSAAAGAATPATATKPSRARSTGTRSTAATKSAAKPATAKPTTRRSSTRSSGEDS